MRGNRFAWLLALAAAALMVAPSAGAQRRRQPQPRPAGPSAEALETAREAYARGQELFRAGSFEAAEEAFLEAYRAVPNPVVLLGLAETRERRGDVPGTIEALEQYLESRPDAPDRAQIEQRLASLRARPAVIVVTSTPPGAAIRIDGEPTERVTPAEIEVSPGEHVVALSLAGHEPASQTVRVGVGARAEASAELVAAGEGLDEDPFGDGGEGAGPPGPPDLNGGEQGLSAGVWVAAGVAGAALVGGTVLGFLALSEQSEFDMMPTEGTADRGERLALFADVAFGVAAIAGITAIVLYLTQDSGPAQDDTPDVAGDLHLDVAAGPSGGAVSARVLF